MSAPRQGRHVCAPAGKVQKAMRGDGSANLRFTLTTAVLPALTKVRDWQAWAQVDGILLKPPLVQKGKQSALKMTDPVPLPLDAAVQCCTSMLSLT